MYFYDVDIIYWFIKGREILFIFIFYDKENWCCNFFFKYYLVWIIDFSNLNEFVKYNVVFYIK